MAAKNYLFTSESVTEGHPDKLADQISDAILDALIEKDPLARVACETSVTTGLVVIIGETSSTAQINAVRVARDTIAEVGYTSADLGLDAEHSAVLVSLDQQSPDIAQGVNSALEHRNGGSHDGYLDSVGDRHPKVGNGVLIGAGAKILGNIRIGDGSKIAAGSVVLNEVPPHSTVAGIPARVVGKPKFADPGRQMEQDVEFDYSI
jgi:hypothetical protein